MDKWLHWIIVAFAWIWVKLHDLVVALGLGFGGGAGWIISIILLTLLVRVAIFPLYLKQIKSQRGMQAIQPEVQKLQARYKGKKDPQSRQRQSEELMELYKKHGTSPYSSCLPLLVQMPVLFALYRVIFAVQRLSIGDYDYPALGPLTRSVAEEISSSTLFGVGLFDTLATTPGLLKAVFVVLIAIMVVFQFLTMRMSMTKNMPPNPDPNNPMVRSQKTMMYAMPAMFIFMGFVFQMALLIYMVTTTLFSWVQQLWVLKVLPTPGSPAYEELLEKREEKYDAWAKPFFTEYDEKVESSGGKEYLESTDGQAYVTQTLTEAKKKSRAEKVYTNFPEEWSDLEKLTVLRTLAFESWKSLPDESWMKELAKDKTSQESTQTRQQPRKLSREQRMRRAEIERMNQEDQQKYEERSRRKEEQRASREKPDLTPEEIERRRQQRRAAQREQRRKKRK